MKAGIVGAGAMGRIFAYYMSKKSIELAVYTKSDNTVQALISGLNVITGEKSEVINIDIDNDPSILNDCDIIFIFVKGTHFYNYSIKQSFLSETQAIIIFSFIII